MESCTLRTHIDAFEDFNTISKYTPAKPDVKHPIITDIRPTMQFDLESAPRCCDNWTSATPQARDTMEVHCNGLKRFDNIKTEKIAVVTIFIWYKTWKTGADSSDIE